MEAHMQIGISDIIEVERKVDIPEKCPKCGIKFDDGAKLNTWQYDSTSQYLEIVSRKDGEIEWGGSSFGGGEGYMIVKIDCGDCGECLADSTEKKFTQDNAPAGIKDMLNIG
jgi:hypothetical protein